MKLLTVILLIIVTAFAASLFLPWQWWYIAVICFLYVVIMNMKPAMAFLGGFCGAGLFWLSLILKHDLVNDHILATRMSGVFFGSPNVILFIFVNALLGTVIGGMAAWSGGLMNKAFR